ncbi:MSS1_2 [Sanghuangporus vaninii]
MPKPTLLQNLFNQPTQTYSSLAVGGKGDGVSQRTKYHSVRNDMLRVAARARARTIAAEIPMPASVPPPPSIPPQHLQLPLNSHEDDDDDTQHNIEDPFFTPAASPRHSLVDQQSVLNTEPNSMGAPLEQPTLRALMDKDPSATASANQNDDGDVTPVAADVSASEPSNDSENDNRPELSRRASPSQSVASSSASLDGSISEASSPTSVSISAPSTSTRVTTPATSESNKQSHSRSSSPTTRSGSLKRKKAESRKAILSMVTRKTYTDNDWAKDVRWLVSPSETNSDKQRKTRHTVSKAPGIATTNGTGTTVTKRSRARPQFELDPMTLIPMLPLSNVPFQVNVPHRRAVSQSTASSRRTIGRRRMSAVWEEDEGDEPAPNSPRRVHTDPAPLTSLGRARSLSTPHRAPPLERARSPTNASLLSGKSDSLASSSAPSSAFTSASRTVDLPNPLPVTNGGTPTGFTSLVLPRAAHPPTSSKRYTLLFGNSSHIDITRTGLAQTTMTTISITKNAASSALGGPRPRFLSLSSLPLLSPGSGSKSDLPKTPSHLLGSLPRPLSITSHTRPPTKVHSHQVLVQVYAVALDGLDDRIVSEKSARKDCYGFVPGRSFVGRVVEAGFEVNNVAKGDWIIGLLDVRKCGALAEFLVVEKRYVARCLRPSPSFTLEQLALLPLCGVPAHRAVRTAGIDADTERNAAHGRVLVLQGHDGAGALAVQALAYAGMHVTAHIPLHADTQRTRTSSTSSASFSEPSDENEHAVHVGIQHSSTREAEERVRRWGARGVRVGDAVEVVENCDAGAFDLVIDTVGGKRIWDACQRVLAAYGQFTTLVGDVSSSPSPSPPVSSTTSPSRTSRSHSPFHLAHHHHHSSSKSDPNLNHDGGGRAVPSINQHFKANLRSIRRTFKARKTIGYALVSPAADVDQCGEDVRDSLVEAVRRAVAGVFVPFVGNHEEHEEHREEDEDEEDEERRRKQRVVPFERAPELFGSGRLSDGRTAVVRVVD